MLTYTALSAAAFVAAAISGAAGFGGALLLLPLLTYAVGATLAIPLLTLAQLIGNLSRVAFGFGQIRWRPASLFLISAVPCSVLGSLSFVALPKSMIVRLIGGAILVLVALRYFRVLRFTPSAKLLIGGGGIVGLLSGLIGSAGPLGAAVFLTLQLPAVAYIATEAVTAVVMHAVKSVVYQHYIQLEQVWVLAVALGLAMILGTWAAKRIIEQMPAERFRNFVAALLVLISLQMLLFG